jgi:hypothetical protein
MEMDARDDAGGSSVSIASDVAAMLDALDKGFPDVTTVPVPELRELIRSRRTPLTRLPDMKSVNDIEIAGPGGSLALRVYRPRSDVDVLPVVVFAHGGGFVFCDLDSHDEFCRSMAQGVGAVVVSVDYRLAPENPAPAAHNDLYAALEWASNNIGQYGGDPGCHCGHCGTRSRRPTPCRSGHDVPSHRRRFRHRVLPTVRQRVLQHDVRHEMVLAAIRTFGDR